MPGYELPNYGSKPIGTYLLHKSSSMLGGLLKSIDNSFTALDADDEHYGVTMEQLKKLLRPSSNNNEEDEESKEDMNIVNRITTSVPAYRRPVTVRFANNNLFRFITSL